MSSKVIKWEACPTCASQRVVRLPTGWELEVNRDHKGIEIVACGSPWHYTISSMDVPAVTAPGLAAALSTIRGVHFGDCEPAAPCQWCRAQAVQAYAAGATIRLGEQPHPQPYPECVAAGCKLHPWVM